MQSLQVVTASSYVATAPNHYTRLDKMRPSVEASESLRYQSSNVNIGTHTYLLGVNLVCVCVCGCVCLGCVADRCIFLVFTFMVCISGKHECLACVYLA